MIELVTLKLLEWLEDEVRGKSAYDAHLKPLRQVRPRHPIQSKTRVHQKVGLLGRFSAQLANGPNLVFAGRIPAVLHPAARDGVGLPAHRLRGRPGIDQS